MVCIGDGVGGADCVLSNGARKYLPPSKLMNYWMTSQSDFEKFSAWCYETSISNMRPVLSSKKDEILGISYY